MFDNINSNERHWPGDIPPFIHPLQLPLSLVLFCLHITSSSITITIGSVWPSFLPSHIQPLPFIQRILIPPPHDCNKCVIFTLPLLFPTGLSESHSPSNTPTMCVSKQVEWKVYSHSKVNSWHTMEKTHEGIGTSTKTVIAIVLQV